MCRPSDPLSSTIGTLSALRHIRELGLDLLCSHVRKFNTRDKLTDHGNRWAYSYAWRLGDATLDGGLFWLATLRAMLHAAEATCNVQTDLILGRRGGWVVECRSQPYHERYVSLRCFVHTYWPWRVPCVHSPLLSHQDAVEDVEGRRTDQEHHPPPQTYSCCT